eukprot:TRINITY_DN6107_c0_g1_i1.p1 TRINITY_DN6107_c0_g1~~TRINITY_DN6107_c0_g1_i1.p1  ORF type:complete len:341 (+),score=31.58 TRINITY_DN6107_c0_g1_i1:103-1023(+)
MTMGADGEDLYAKFSPLLQGFIKSNTYSDQIRASSIKAVTLACFITSSDNNSTLELIELFTKLLFPNGSTSSLDPIVLSALLESWNLLHTTLPISYILRKSLPKLKALVEYMISSDAIVSVCAGESLALIFSLLRENATKNENEFNLKNYSAHVDIANMLAAMKSVSSTSVKKVGRNTQKFKRQNFNAIFKSVEMGSEFDPEETFTIDGQSFDICGWDKFLQWQFVREILLTGMQEHVRCNDLLNQIFEYDLEPYEPAQSLSKVEKRLYKSPNSFASKNRTRTRGKERVDCARSQAQFVHQDQNWQ